MILDPTHRYAQQATKLTQRLFVITSIMVVLFVVLAIWQSWWWLLGVVAIVVFWGVYSTQMRTVPVRDLTSGEVGTVEMGSWKDFKQKYPQRVAKNGAQE